MVKESQLRGFFRDLRSETIRYLKRETVHQIHWLLLFLIVVVNKKIMLKKRKMSFERLICIKLINRRGSGWRGPRREGAPKSVQPPGSRPVSRWLR
jgi:hypothetical protein